MKVLYFAWVRQKVGIAEEEVAPPDDVKTVGDLVTWLHRRSPAHAEALFDTDVVRCAVNQEHVQSVDHPISKDDEIAFFPPVTGG